jgi:hypothetical protein
MFSIMGITTFVALWAMAGSAMAFTIVKDD